MVRFVMKGSHRFELVATTSSDETGHCPQCDSQFDKRRCRKTKFVACGHFICLECVGKVTNGCKKCSTITLIELVDTDCSTVVSNDGDSQSVVELVNSALSNIKKEPADGNMEENGQHQSEQNNMESMSRWNSEGDLRQLAFVDTDCSTVVSNDGEPQSVVELVNSVLSDMKEEPADEEMEENGEHQSEHSMEESISRGNSEGDLRQPASGTPYTYDCIHCDAKLKEFKDIGGHLRAHHSELVPFVCDVCQFPFETKKLLDWHKGKHLYDKKNSKKSRTSNVVDADSTLIQIKIGPDEQGESSAASSCFPRMNPVASPKEKMHPRASSTSTFVPDKRKFLLWTCRHCPRAFSSKFNLNLHTRLRHSDLFPYHCDICGTPFSRRGALNFHMRFHTKKRVYKCSECSSSYDTPFSLECHVGLCHAVRVDSSTLT